MNTKKCPRCNLTKDLNLLMFSASKQTKSGFNSWCRTCYQQYGKSRYVPRKGKGRHPRDPSVPEGCRKCTKCKEIKLETLEFFNKLKNGRNGLNPRCRVCAYAYWLSMGGKERSALYAKTPEAKRKKQQYVKKLYSNPEFRSIRNSKLKQKRKEDPMFRVASNIRRAVSGCTKYNGFKKTSKLHQYLGCSSSELKAYLESLFKPGMTWENYGHGNDKWNIDHIIPLTSAETVEDLYKLNHFTNLQPLWQPENLAKHDKMPTGTALPNLVANAPKI